MSTAPTEYYTSIYSGEEIDAAISKIKNITGTDIPVSVEDDTDLADALAGKAPAYGSTQLIGNIPITNISTPGWYRICTMSGRRGAALIHICHECGSGGPSDLLVYVNFSQYNPVLTILTSGYYDTYPIDDIRLMQDGTSPIFHLDIHYSLSISNSVGADYWATSAWGSNSVDITPQNAALVDDAPTGETELMTAEWSAPPMVLGVEYRTTERYNGKPVYVQTRQFGSVAENTNTSISFASGVDKVLRYSGNAILSAYDNQSVALPWNYSETNYIRLSAQRYEDSAIRAFIYSTYLISEVYVQVWYTKTTD